MHILSLSTTSEKEASLEVVATGCDGVTSSIKPPSALLSILCIAGKTPLSGAPAARGAMSMTSAEAPGTKSEPADACPHRSSISTSAPPLYESCVCVVDPVTSGASRGASWGWLPSLPGSPCCAEDKVRRQHLSRQNEEQSSSMGNRATALPPCPLRQILRSPLPRHPRPSFPAQPQPFPIPRPSFPALSLRPEAPRRPEAWPS